MNNWAMLTELYRSILQRVGSMSNIQIYAVPSDSEEEVIVCVDGVLLQQGNMETLIKNNYLYCEIKL